MPEGYTHRRVAEKAAATVHYRIKHPQAFAAGANGPDSFFCFEAWKKAKKRRYDLPALGHRMHQEQTGPFLLSLLDHVHTGAQVEYALGFLAHYAADTVVHPYVAALCQPGMPYAGKGGHGCFEIALDSTLYAEDSGSALVPGDVAAPLPTGEDMGDIAALLHTCLQEVYGLDLPMEYLVDAFYYSNRLRRLFPSRFGVRRAFFWLAETFVGGRGYITSHVSPRKLKKDLPADWTDPYSGEERHGDAMALLGEAQARAERFMAAALVYWMGRLPREELVELLGSMSYSEGRSTAQSDPAYVPPPPPPEAPGPEEEPDKPAEAAGTPKETAEQAPTAAAEETPDGAGESATPVTPGIAALLAEGAAMEMPPAPAPEAPPAEETAPAEAAPVDEETPAQETAPEAPAVEEAGAEAVDEEQSAGETPVDETVNEAPPESPEAPGSPETEDQTSGAAADTAAPEAVPAADEVTPEPEGVPETPAGEEAGAEAADEEQVAGETPADETANEAPESEEPVEAPAVGETPADETVNEAPGSEKPVEVTTAEETPTDEVPPELPEALEPAEKDPAQTPPTDPAPETTPADGADPAPETDPTEQEGDTL